MKKLLLGMIIALCSAGYSQVLVNGVNVNEQDVQYCKLVAYNKSLFGSKIIITVDYGQKHKWNEHQIISLPDGKNMEFHTVVGALNFMDKNGWQYLNSYAITMGSSNVYHYLLKKKD